MSLQNACMRLQRPSKKKRSDMPNHPQKDCTKRLSQNHTRLPSTKDLFIDVAFI